jgi:hypothetical protein
MATTSIHINTEDKQTLDAIAAHMADQAGLRRVPVTEVVRTLIRREAEQRGINTERKDADQ